METSFPLYVIDVYFSGAGNSPSELKLSLGIYFMDDGEHKFYGRDSPDSIRVFEKIDASYELLKSSCDATLLRVENKFWEDKSILLC